MYGSFPFNGYNYDYCTYYCGWPMTIFQLTVLLCFVYYITKLFTQFDFNLCALFGPGRFECHFKIDCCWIFVLFSVHSFFGEFLWQHVGLVLCYIFIEYYGRESPRTVSHRIASDRIEPIHCGNPTKVQICYRFYIAITKIITVWYWKCIE